MPGTDPAVERHQRNSIHESDPTNVPTDVSPLEDEITEEITESEEIDEEELDNEANEGDEVVEADGQEEGDHDEEDEDGEDADDDDESDDVLSEEELQESPFAYHPSEEDFQESDLQSRKDRRYLLGTHSFLELNDPQLEDALVPAHLDGESSRRSGKHHKGLNAERDKYKELCKNAGFKPNPTFLQSLGTSILDLTNHGLSDKEIEAICMTLCNDKHIEICRLSGNACGKIGGLAIAEMIKDNYTIEELSLANTEILESLEEICEAVSLTTSLISIDLSKNELIDQDMSPISNMIAENQSLKKLFLGSNEIRDAGLAELGVGLSENKSILEIDLSRNKIRGENRAARFFTSCGTHPQLRVLNFSHNLIRNEGSNGFSRILYKNDRIQNLDLSFNIMEEGAGPNLARGLGTGAPRDLETLHVEQQWWHQESAGTILRPLGNRKNMMPIELVDFGWMLDVHKSFLNARDRALAAHPEMKIIHGEPYGLKKAKGPDEKPLVIRRANIVCENFVTPLVMLMEELAKEPKKLSKTAFRKFIKQCNLYKDKSLTDAFENVFATPSGEVDGEAILAAFDKEYPGKRVIPDPEPEGEVKEEVKKEKKKKGAKGGKAKGKGKGAAKSKSKTAAGGGGKGAKEKASKKPKTKAKKGK
ncbi:leucine-rich repeat-containing protein 74A-like [Folsomia candida]|uniref:leucine-rich repeat-containing protein 74A-like n=1 Tax=Folsomia candida TaxID=158441 RepID=UPI001604A96D|nr:leucine-rich repeat-containing protein 74A-like [Folsomia candida]